jgi:hypothetical protein
MMSYAGVTTSLTFVADAEGRGQEAANRDNDGPVERSVGDPDHGPLRARWAACPRRGYWRLALRDGEFTRHPAFEIR